MSIMETKQSASIDNNIDVDIDGTITSDDTDHSDKMKELKSLSETRCITQAQEINQNKQVSVIIAEIFEHNRLNDLIRFMKKRQCLNEANIVLIYLFHIIQACGIITTTIAGGYNIKELIWVGISLNLIASLINIFEKTNNNLSIKLYKNIKDIKDNKYIDESILIEEDKQLSADICVANKSFYYGDNRVQSPSGLASMAQGIAPTGQIMQQMAPSMPQPIAPSTQQQLAPSTPQAMAPSLPMAQYLRQISKNPKHSQMQLQVQIPQTPLSKSSNKPIMFRP